MDAAVIALDKANVVWEGKPKYASLEDLLSDADRALYELEL